MKVELVECPVSSILKVRLSQAVGRQKIPDRKSINRSRPPLNPILDFFSKTLWVLRLIGVGLVLLSFVIIIGGFMAVAILMFIISREQIRKFREQSAGLV